MSFSQYINMVLKEKINFYFYLWHHAFPYSYRYIYHHKNTERENKMNNKRIIKTISAIALLLSLSLTACGTQDTQLLTATEESMQETATQETEANTDYNRH